MVATAAPMRTPRASSVFSTSSSDVTRSRRSRAAPAGCPPPAASRPRSNARALAAQHDLAQRGRQGVPVLGRDQVPGAVELADRVGPGRHDQRGEASVGSSRRGRPAAPCGRRSCGLGRGVLLELGQQACWVSAQVVMPTMADRSMAPTPKASVMRAQAEAMSCGRSSIYGLCEAERRSVRRRSTRPGGRRAATAQPWSLYRAHGR